MMGFDPISMMAAGYILAAAEGCPAQDAPGFDVQVQDSPPVIDESHSSAELTASQQAFQVAAANSDNPLSQYAARDQRLFHALEGSGQFEIVGGNGLAGQVAAGEQNFGNRGRGGIRIGKDIDRPGDHFQEVADKTRAAAHDGGITIHHLTHRYRIFGRFILHNMYYTEAAERRQPLSSKPLNCRNLSMH